MYTVDTNQHAIMFTNELITDWNGINRLDIEVEVCNLVRNELDVVLARDHKLPLTMKERIIVQTRTVAEMTCALIASKSDEYWQEVIKS